jgi:putative ABC transport system permease protein
MRSVLRRFAYLFQRRRFESDLAEEMAFHRVMKEHELMKNGDTATDIAPAVNRALGSVTLARERSRDVWAWSWAESLFDDLRFALRALRRDRAFTLAALVMLTLAIGLNVTVFAIVDATLFRGFPHVKRNNRLLFLRNHYPTGLEGITYPDFEEWRAQVHAFSGMAFVRGQPVTVRDGNGRSMDTQTWAVSANTFGLLGVAPMLGRDFAPADEFPSAAPVAILSYEFWNNRFDKRTDIVGSAVQLNGKPGTIIGVMPEGFAFPLPQNLWTSIVRSPEMQQRGFGAPQAFAVVGRLRDGVSAQAARAELETIDGRLEQAYPETNRGLVPTVITHATLNSGPDAPITWGSLWVAAWCVLLIACANLANLTLVRTIGRWRELSTKMALGANWGRMVRQMMLESVILTGAAGLLGWWLTRWSVRTWSVMTTSRFQVLDYSVDARTLAYLVAISLTAMILFSVAPIVRVVQLGMGGGLKDEARGVTQGVRTKRLTAGLVIGQVALAIVLLSGTGVVMQSFMNIVSAETGVRYPDHILVGMTSLPSDTYGTAAERLVYFERLGTRLKTIGGVEEAAVATNIPVYGIGVRALELHGRPKPLSDAGRVQFLKTGPGYFRVLGASAIAGRDFNDGDRAASLPVAIVNQSFAATFWPGEDPLGKRLRSIEPNQPSEWRVVVGVVPNIMQGDALRQHFKPLVYVPFEQEPAPRRVAFLARTSAPPADVAPAVRLAVQGLDPNVVLEGFDTLKARFAFDRDYMDWEHSELGKHAKVGPIFALMAILLVAVGLYAVIAHAVSTRTKEIGIRLAIGATAGDVRRMIAREGLWPVATGLLLGLAVSVAVNRLLQSQLVGVSPYDPATMVGAPVVLIIVAMVACQIPARRAMSVDPVVALRHD